MNFNLNPYSTWFQESDRLPPLHSGHRRSSSAKPRRRHGSNSTYANLHLPQVDTRKPSRTRRRSSKTMNGGEMLSPRNHVSTAHLSDVDLVKQVLDQETHLSHDAQSTLNLVIKRLSDKSHHKKRGQHMTMTSQLRAQHLPGQDNDDSKEMGDVFDDILNWLNMQYSDGTTPTLSRRGSVELTTRTGGGRAELDPHVSFADAMRRQSTVADNAGAGQAGGGQQRPLSPPKANENPPILTSLNSLGPNALLQRAPTALMRNKMSPQTIQSIKDAIARQKEEREQRETLVRQGSKLQKLISDTSQFPSLQHLHDWQTFDIFQFALETEGMPLGVMLCHLFLSLNFLTHFKLDARKLYNYVCQVESGYKDIPYHNAIHAADVMHSTFFFLSQESVRGLVREMDVFAALIAAAVHDFQHPGLTNNFQVNAVSEHAVAYNDISVLEMMHVSSAYKLLLKDKNNFIRDFPREDQIAFRETMIHIVLATDMKSHTANVALLQEALEDKTNSGTWFAPHTKEDRKLILNIVVHTADISNPTKPLKVALRWAELLFQEFFAQGDEEKRIGLPVSPMCDRNNTPYAKANMAFGEYVVQPLLSIWSKVCPEAKVCIDMMRSNRQFWLDRVHDAKQTGVPYLPDSLKRPSVSSVSSPRRTPSQTPRSGNTTSRSQTHEPIPEEAAAEEEETEPS